MKFAERWNLLNVVKYGDYDTWTDNHRGDESITLHSCDTFWQPKVIIQKMLAFGFLLYEERLRFQVPFLSTVSKAEDLDVGTLETGELYISVTWKLGMANWSKKLFGNILRGK